jgi:hypothetical protein
MKEAGETIIGRVKEHTLLNKEEFVREIGKMTSGTVMFHLVNVGCPDDYRHALPFSDICLWLR